MEAPQQPLDLSDQFIGNLLYRLRERKGVSRKYLAAAMSVTVEQLTAFENGREQLPLSRAYLAMDFLGLDIENLAEGLPDVFANNWESALVQLPCDAG